MTACGKQSFQRPQGTILTGRQATVVGSTFGIRAKALTRVSHAAPIQVQPRGYELQALEPGRRAGAGMAQSLSRPTPPDSGFRCRRGAAAMARGWEGCAAPWLTGRCRIEPVGLALDLDLQLPIARCENAEFDVARDHWPARRRGGTARTAARPGTAVCWSVCSSIATSRAESPAVRYASGEANLEDQKRGGAIAVEPGRRRRDGIPAQYAPPAAAQRVATHHAEVPSGCCGASATAAFFASRQQPRQRQVPSTMTRDRARPARAPAAPECPT